MNEIYLLPKDERVLFFRIASDIMNIPFEIIEKDYWVVWILEQLFALEKLKSHLTFKGGTSLSKIYGLIDRFSEDIDLSIERDFFDFGPPNDPESAPSKKKQQTILDNLSKACSSYVQTQMLENLKDAIATKLGTTEVWSLFSDPEDSDAQTLLFEYPSETSKIGYIRPLVKIEIGARSEHWPVSEHKIQSYAKDALEQKIHEPEIRVRVLHAERTFWEKATILHQYAHLPEDKKLPSRISRHFYDFFRLLISPIKEKALVEEALLERVAIHKSIYFASSWANYGTARKGTLKLLPPPYVLKELKTDYTLMAAMFFRDIPDWELILNTIESFEKEFNNYSETGHKQQLQLKIDALQVSSDETISSVIQDMAQGKLRGEALHTALERAIQKAENVNQQTLNGHKFLQLLINTQLDDRKKLALVKALVERGAEVDVVDKSGLTPFQVAILKQSKSIADFLHSKGAAKRVPSYMHAQYYALYLQIPIN
jgi:hypothetical protein